MGAEEGGIEPRCSSNLFEDLPDEGNSKGLVRGRVTEERGVWRGWVRNGEERQLSGCVDETSPGVKLDWGGD